MPNTTQSWMEQMDWSWGEVNPLPSPFTYELAHTFNMEATSNSSPLQVIHSLTLTGQLALGENEIMLTLFH